MQQSKTVIFTDKRQIETKLLEIIRDNKWPSSGLSQSHWTSWERQRKLSHNKLWQKVL